MPTILTHAAIPLTLGLGLGKPVISRRLMALGVIASALPDFDVVAFMLGIPYASILGHRGLTHSIAFALLIAVLAAFSARTVASKRYIAFGFVFVATVSHPLLDALTNGGLGVALLWPYSNERLFAPWQVIQVSPIGVHFFSLEGIRVLFSECCWVWIPCAFVLASLVWIRHRLVTMMRGNNPIPY